MAKNHLPRDIATVVFADCCLAAGAQFNGVWEVTLTSTLVIIDSEENEPIILPAGAILYLPMGQMDVWPPIAASLARARMLAIAAGEGPVSADLVEALDQIDAPPF